MLLLRSPRAAGLAALLLCASAVTAAACSRREAPPAAATANGSTGTTAAGSSAARPAAQPAAAAMTTAPTDTLSQRADASRIQGSATAGLWMVEISDFQCPFCKRWHDDTYAEIKRDYVDAGKIRFAYVNLPLPMHKHAWLAAQTAMCAGLQGKFWALHDSLFASQGRWEKLEAAQASAVFDSLVSKAGADASRTRACVQGQALRPLVQADYDRSVQAGVQSTPTFMIGQRIIEGAAPTAEFRKVLDSALAAGGK